MPREHKKSCSTKLTAKLTPGREVTPPTIPVGVDPRGYARVTVDEKRGYVKYYIKIKDLTSDLLVVGNTAAHFHLGAAGTDGPVLRDITLEASCDCESTNVYTACGKWKESDLVQPLTGMIIDQILTGLVYINVHTVDNPAGEVRGQLVL